MAKVNDDNLALRVTPSQTTHINKPIVILLTALVIFLIGFAIIEALNSSSSQHKANQLLVQQRFSPTVSDAIKSLPEDYQQSDTIKKYFNSSTDLVPASVQQELSDLKDQQALLQQKLLLLSGGASQSTEDQRQAATSGLFFPGVAPRRDDEQPSSDQSVAKVNADVGNVTTPQATTDAYAAQNMQMQKLGFLKPSKEVDDIYDKHNLTTPLSPYEIQAGTILSSVLITGIDTSLPGDVVAQVQGDLYDSMTGRYLLVPKGSKLIGKYDSQIAYGQTRVLIVFYRIIRPNGTSIILSQSTGADLLGQSGMEGDVNNHWWRVIGATTLSTILSMGAGVAAYSAPNPSAGQNALLGAAGSLSQTGQNLTDRAMNIQPTLKIPAGYQFNVIVNKDMVLEPYHEAE